MQHTPPIRLYSRRHFGELVLGALASALPLSAAYENARVLRGMPPSAPGPSPINASDKDPDPPGDVFLKEQAQRIIDSARLRSGAAAGQFRNATPHDLHVPGGNMGYPAFWIRDAVMMLGGDFIAAPEVEGWIRLICSTLRSDEWQVRPGVLVPGFTVPDHITFDGKPSFYPGSYETGERQGGHPWGKFPPLDDGFYFILAVHEHRRLTGGIDLFRAKLPTAAEAQPLADICEHIYRAVPCDPETGLVTAGDVDTENAKDWGFCDSVFKSGKLLFPSILKLIAAKRLADLSATSAEPGKAVRYRTEATHLAQSLVPAFFHPSEDGTEPWLHSATGIGNQPDVWGSAFAVHAGALDPAAAAQVSRALVRAFRERTAVREGFIRHLPTTDRLNNGGWERSVSALGEYQNGGYWGTPVGWYISAMHQTDPDAAAALAREYIQTLRQHMRPEGMTQAWEWRNPETGKSSNPLYVATVALPYLSLKEAGLLSLLRPG